MGLLSEGSEWTFPLLEKYNSVIAGIAGEYELDTYPVQLEVIHSEQMMDAYASVGMPVGYNHWSYGKQFLEVENRYKRGHMGLAYEIVINSNPSIAYLMEENTMMMMALVIAHAAYGHNSFFKGNYLFQTWTSPESIIDYLIFARNFIAECEDKYGIDRVEALLDSCHALMLHGIDAYKRPPPLSVEKEKERMKKRMQWEEQRYDDVMDKTVPKSTEENPEGNGDRFPEEPEENILRFVEEHAPLLALWEREIIRIVRMIAQYFYPQRLTKVMNEGWACFWHYTIMRELERRRLVSQGFMLEFISSHTNVLSQPPFNSKFYSGINVYALGFAMMQDIKRICENPTDEDREWFPHIAGGDWRQVLFFAMKNFQDESFIHQYLSPYVIRELKLFSVVDDAANTKYLEISAIHNKEGYKHVRSVLAANHDVATRVPQICVWSVDTEGDRSLRLRHSEYMGKPLNEQTTPEVLKHLARLWRFKVHIDTVDKRGHTRKSHSCDPGPYKKP